MEGTAEFLGRHDWDGACVRLGVRPLGTLEDLPASALDRWEQGASFDDILDDSQGRPLAMALVRWLESGALRERFHEFRGAADAGVEDEAQELRDAVGGLDGREDEFETWLGDQQNPMTPVYLEWLHVGPATFDGSARGVVSFARLKEPPTAYEQTIRLTGTAGAIVGFQDLDHYTALLLDPDGAVNAFEVDDTGAFWWDAGSVPPPGALVRWRHEFVGDEVVVTIDGQEVRRPVRFPHAGGPALNDSEVRFEEIAWEPR